MKSSFVKEKKSEKQLSLNCLWGKRLRLRAEGCKLQAEGCKLQDEGNKLWAEGYKLRAEGNKLRAESYKLWAEGYKLWAEAILRIHGNIKLEWKNYNKEKEDYECHLETGEIFYP